MCVCVGGGGWGGGGEVNRELDETAVHGCPRICTVNKLRTTTLLHVFL